jgi:hypothetical protein
MIEEKEHRYSLHMFDRTNHRPMMSVEISCFGHHCTFPRVILWHAKAKRIAEAVTQILLDAETS